MGLKILMILYSVPKCSLSMGPISLPLLLASNKIFLLWFFVSPASGFTLFSTCFKKPVLCWSTSSTLTVAQLNMRYIIFREPTGPLDLEFLSLDQLCKSSEMSWSLILLLLFSPFKEFMIVMYYCIPEHCSTCFSHQWHQRVFKFGTTWFCKKFLSNET